MPSVDKTIDYLTQRKRSIPPLIAVLALIGMGRVARVASMGLVTLWAVDFISGLDRVRAKTKPSAIADKAIDTAMEDSFPASDPPSYSSNTTGTPNEFMTDLERPEHLH